MSVARVHERSPPYQFLSPESRATRKEPARSLPIFAVNAAERAGVANVGGFTEGQRRFLDFHRNAVLLSAMR